MPTPRRVHLHLAACVSLALGVALGQAWGLGARQRWGVRTTEIQLDRERLEEQLRILGGWSRRSRRRPRYSRRDALRILEHGDRFQLRPAELARDFLLAPATVYRWIKRRRVSPWTGTGETRPPCRRICDERRERVVEMVRAGYESDRGIVRHLLHMGERVSARSAGRFRRWPLAAPPRAEPAPAPPDRRPPSRSRPAPRTLPVPGPLALAGRRGCHRPDRAGPAVRPQAAARDRGARPRESRRQDPGASPAAPPSNTQAARPCASASPAAARTHPGPAPQPYWSSDITTIELQRQFHLATVLDLFSRDVLAWELYDRPPSSEQIAALFEGAVARHGPPQHFVSDHGGQFLGEPLQAALATRGTDHRKGAVGQHGSIAITERLWRTTKELLDTRLGRPVVPQILYERVGVVIDYYRTKRPHSALGAATPAEAYAGQPDPALAANSMPRGWPGQVRPAAPFVIRHALPLERRLPYLQRIA